MSSFFFSKRRTHFLYGKWTEFIKCTDYASYEEYCKENGYKFKRADERSKSPNESPGNTPRKVLSKLNSIKLSSFKSLSISEVRDLHGERALTVRKLSNFTLILAGRPAGTGRRRGHPQERLHLLDRHSQLGDAVGGGTATWKYRRVLPVYTVCHVAEPDGGPHARTAAATVSDGFAASARYPQAGEGRHGRCGGGEDAPRGEAARKPEEV